MLSDAALAAGDAARAERAAGEVHRFPSATRRGGWGVPGQDATRSRAHWPWPGARGCRRGEARRRDRSARGAGTVGCCLGHPRKGAPATEPGRGRESVQGSPHLGARPHGHCLRLCHRRCCRRRGRGVAGRGGGESRKPQRMGRCAAPRARSAGPETASAAVGRVLQAGNDCERRSLLGCCPVVSGERERGASLGPRPRGYSLRAPVEQGLARRRRARPRVPAEWPVPLRGDLARGPDRSGVPATLRGSRTGRDAPRRHRPRTAGPRRVRDRARHDRRRLRSALRGPRVWRDGSGAGPRDARRLAPSGPAASNLERPARRPVSRPPGAPRRDRSRGAANRPLGAYLRRDGHGEGEGGPRSARAFGPRGQAVRGRQCRVSQRRALSVGGVRPRPRCVHSRCRRQRRVRLASRRAARSFWTRSPIFRGSRR